MDRMWSGEKSRPLAGPAILLVQIAASHAEIGPFARRGQETPQAAARCYEAAARRSARGRERLVA